MGAVKSRAISNRDEDNKPYMRFVSFHTHSTYSHADGFGPVPMHVDRVADLGMQALAFSEHGNVNSHVALERECRRRNIKPIFGLEAYFAQPDVVSKFHITLFAMDQEGYINLNKIVTESWKTLGTTSKSKFPTTNWDVLRDNNKGIVAFSGCSDSLVSCTLLGGKSLGPKRESYSDEDYRNTRRRIERLHEVFDGRFYLEVQRFPGLERTCILNPAFAELSRDTGVPLIATADVHYPFPYQNEMQKTLHASRRGSTIAVSEAEWEYDILLTYPESDEEIHDDLVDTGLTDEEAKAAIDNTTVLAERCTVELPKAKTLRFPGIDMPIKTTDENRKRITEKFLMKKLKEGWDYRVAQRPELEKRKKEYSDRFKYEMSVIFEKDFMDYFLVVSDLIIRAKDSGTVVGLGRGSAAASLMAYLLRITEMDPLHPVFSKMVFERFLDITRSDPPDIDIDFDDERRKETEAMAKEIYGDDCVANIGNHVKYKGKSALSGVAAAYGYSRKIFNTIGKRCPDRVETDDRVGNAIEDIIDAYADDPESDVSLMYMAYHEEIDRAMMLEGNEHSMSIHAAGYAISSEPITNVCPIYTKTENAGRKVKVSTAIPYDKRDAEYLGFIKMDFLGLITCNVLARCMELTGVTLDELYTLFYETYLDNGDGTCTIDEVAETILEKFREDDLMGIFQFEGATTRHVVSQVEPDEIQHLFDINALSRPGPYYGGQKDEYIRIRREGADWHRIHPGFDSHVEWTNGQIVYQEQIMFILRDLAGFDVPTVLKVRKIIGKKLGEFQFEQLWAQFRDGCAGNGVSEEDAHRVWSAIRTAAGYAFNFAHSASYTIMSWLCQWFKAFYPEEFFVATLAKNGDGKDDLPRRTRILQDVVAHGIPILPFTLADCQENWSLGFKEVGSNKDGSPQLVLAPRPGFMQIPKVADNKASDIVEWRNRLPAGEKFKAYNWYFLEEVNGIGEKTAQRVEEFADREDPLGIWRTEKQLVAFRQELKRGDYNNSGIPTDGYAMSDGLDSAGEYVWVGFVQNIVYKDEIENVRTKTGQSVEQIKAGLKSPHLTKKATLFCYDEHGEIAIRVSRWRFFNLNRVIKNITEDYSILVVKGKTFEDESTALQAESMWILEPD